MGIAIRENILKHIAEELDMEFTEVVTINDISVITIEFYEKLFKVKIDDYTVKFNIDDRQTSMLRREWIRLEQRRKGSAYGKRDD